MLCNNGTQMKMGGGYVFVCRVDEDDDFGMDIINRCEFVRWCFKTNQYEMVFPKCEECKNINLPQKQ